LEETKEHVERLDRIGRTLGVKLSGKKCKAMEGLIEEGAEALESEGPGPVIDAALIAAAQRVEHYEISAYGTVRAIAEHSGHEDIVDMLQETLDEESAADEKLTAISQGEVLPAAVSAAKNPGEDEESWDGSERDREEHGGRSGAGGRHERARGNRRQGDKSRRAGGAHALSERSKH
jgi:ferritin-like metal-binding protein YciE